MGWRTPNNGLIRIQRSNPDELKDAINENIKRGYVVVEIIQDMSFNDAEYLQKRSDYFNRSVNTKRPFNYESGSNPVNIAIMKKSSLVNEL